MPDIDYAALAAQHGAIAPQPAGGAVDYEALAKQNGAVSSQPAAAAPAAPQSWLDHTINAVKEYGSGLGTQINPVTMFKGARDAAYNAVTDPVGTVKALGQAQGAVGQKALDSFKDGDYASGIRHAIGYMLPLVGPQIDAMGDEMATNPAHALGSATGLGLTMAAPDSPVVANAVKKLPAMPIIPKLANSNPVEAAAVNFARSNGIPMDAATATGNKFVAGTQALADHSPIGSVIAEKAKAAQASAFTRVGGELADQAHPAPMVPATAADAVSSRFGSKISQLRNEADAGYSDFRAHAQNNVQAVSNGAGMEDIAMPVDLRAIKQNLQPLYDEMMQWMPVSSRNSSEGFAAVKGLINGPDYMAAPVAEKGLGGLKSLAREADSPDLRNVSQGIGANVAGQLQSAIDGAAAKGGPDALKALQDGRAAHAEKMDIADTLGKLRDEPVQMFNQLTYAKDAGVEQLRKVAKVAPAEMGMVGHAYLQNLMDTATVGGGFDKAGSIAAKWENLGSETKQILFKNPMLVKDLDSFFQAGKMAARNPNPSGSALVGSIAGSAAYVVRDPIHGVPLMIGAGALSKMLHSPAGVDALTTGLKVSTANKAAASMTAARILKLAGGAAQPALAAENPSPAEQTGQTAEAPPLR